MIISQFSRFVNTFRINFFAASLRCTENGTSLHRILPVFGDLRRGSAPALWLRRNGFPIRARLTLFVIAACRARSSLFAPRPFNAFRYCRLISRRSSLFAPRLSGAFRYRFALTHRTRFAAVRFDRAAFAFSLASSALPLRGSASPTCIIAACIFCCAYSFPRP